MELYVGRRTTGASFVKVWPADEQLTPGLIEEARDYIFELRDCPDAAQTDLLIDELPLEALRSTDPTVGRWLWSPGFYAGGIDVSVKTAGALRARFELVTDPARHKLTRHHFDQMVEEILQDTYSLFNLSSFRVRIAKGTTTNPPPVARLEYLRSRIEEIIRVVRLIAARPARVIEPERRRFPYYRAGTVRSLDIARSLRSGKVARQTGETTLPEALEGYLPLIITKTVKTLGLDIREHRDIKASLKFWSTWLKLIADRLRGTQSEDADLRTQYRIWTVRIRRLSGRLDELLSLPLFEEVSDRVAPVVITPVYRRVPAYRQFFRLYQEARLGLSNVFGDFLQLPLARTFDLYELWCFFRLLRAAVTLFHLDNLDLGQLFVYAPDQEKVTIPKQAITIDLGNGYSLAFQRTYREFWVEVDGQGSFSRSMRPDMALTVPNADDSLPTLVVLDAKYRVDSELNDAVSSIHMYRDALVRTADEQVHRIVAGAYLLTPRELPFGTNWQESSMPGRLFHPAYRSHFKFGAVMLQPGMNIGEVQAALEGILADAAATGPTVT